VLGQPLPCDNLEAIALRLPLGAAGGGGIKSVVQLLAGVGQSFPGGLEAHLGIGTQGEPLFLPGEAVLEAPSAN
jgi:hypothetical protein